MRVAVESARARAASRSGTAASTAHGGAIAGLAAALACTAVFLGDGTSEDRLFWIGTVATLGACAAAGAALAGRIPWPRLTAAGSACVAGFGVFTLVSSATILWSFAPDRSWAFANRAWVYLALLVLGLFAGGLVERAPRRAALLLAVVAAAAAGWALAGKVAPALFPDGARIARLREPVGYWNALALLLATGMPVALWLGSRPAPYRRLERFAAPLLFLLVVAALLTYSRGGIAAALPAVAVWLLLTRNARGAAPTLAGGLAPGIAVAAFAFTQDGLVEDLQPYDVRVAAGWKLGLALALGAAAAWGLAQALGRRLETSPPLAPGRPGVTRLAAAGLAAVLIAVVLVLAFRAGDPAGWFRSQVDEFTSPVSSQVTQEPSRLGSLSSNNRWSWWQETWGAFLDRPLGGTGAGTFEVVHRRERETSLTSDSPHSLPLQVLGETGLAGFLPFAAFAAAAVVALRQALRRLGGEERVAAAALAAGLAAVGFHMLTDKDWGYVAVVGPAMLALGVLLAAGLPAGGRSGRLAFAAAAVAVAFGALYSLAAPYTASRLVDRTYELLGLDAGTRSERVANMEAALASGRRAASLNPLSLEAARAHALAAQVIGFQSEGLGAVERAASRHSENPEAWLVLADYEFRAFDPPHDGQAYEHVLRAYELDPYDVRIGDLKDQLEAWFLERKREECLAGKC
jgi:hypothetical protein